MKLHEIKVILIDATVGFMALMVILALFTSCSGGPDSPSTNKKSPLDPQGPPIVMVSPLPVPSPAPSSLPPACKDLKSIWQTSTAPLEQLMGVWNGVNGSPKWNIDLTNLHTGYNEFKMFNTYSCYYDLTVTGSSIVINSTQGCSVAVVPPGHPQNEQCSYCPYDGFTAIVLNYVKTCNGLQIQDTINGQSLFYN